MRYISLKYRGMIFIKAIISLIMILAISFLPLYQASAQDSPGLELYTSLGYGSIQELAWKDDLIYITTSAGIWIYEQAFLNQNLIPYQETYSGNILEASFENGIEQLVTQSDPGTVNVQTVADGEYRELSFLAHSDTITTSAIYPSKDLIAVARTSLAPLQIPSGDDFDIRLWNSNSGEEIFVLQGHTRVVVDLVFSPDGQFLASASYDGTVRLWDMSDGEQVFELLGGSPLAFSNDGKNLLFSKSNSVFSYDLTVPSSENNPSEIFQTSSIVREISADSHYIASGDDEGWLYLYDTELQQLTTWQAHSEAITAIQVNSRMSKIASSTDTELKIWDIKSNRLLTEVSDNFTEAVRDIDWIDDKNIVAAELYSVRIWDFNSLSQLCLYDIPFVDDIEVGNNGTLWVSKYNDVSRIIGCDSSPTDGFFAGEEIRTMKFTPENSEIARYGWIEIFNLESGIQVLRIEGHHEPINALDFSPNGELLASGSGIVYFDVIPAKFDQTVRLWNLENGEQIAEFLGTESPVYALAFSPDGKQLASGHDNGVIQIWDVEHQTLLSTFTATSWVTALAYDPNSSLLVSGDGSGAIILWDIATNQSIATLTKHYEAITAIEFSPTKDYLSVSSRDGTISIWTVLN